jgi:two-component system, NtrC family, sensor kinase
VVAGDVALHVMTADHTAPETIVHSSRPSVCDGDEPVWTGEGRPPRRLSWPLRVLLAGALAIPALLLALAARENIGLVQRHAEERVAIEAGELGGHDQNAFEIYRVVLGWVMKRVGSPDWGRVTSDLDLHRLLADLATLPQIDAVWVVDASGRVRAGSRFFPAPSSVSMGADDAFTAQQPADAGTYVGRTHRDALTHHVVFDISRRISAPGDRFDGAILVSARPEYFVDFYARITGGKNNRAWLLRDDGSVLAEFPADAAASEPNRNTPFMRSIATAPDSTAFGAVSPADGIERIYALHRLAEFPVDAVVGVPKRDLLPAWPPILRNCLAFAVPAAIALWAMTWLAARLIKRERLASWRWRSSAQRLRHEIDRRARTEAELSQAQRIEALGQMTGGVAHDFNNLLAVLQGCLEMLTGRQADERLQKRVNLALETVSRGNRLVRQLLAFARPGAAAVVPLDLNAELRGMSELLARTVGSGIKLVVELDPDLRPIDADPTRLELVVVNLVVNARDAMPDGGTLSIRTTHRAGAVQSGDTAPEQVVELEISDTGTGMPPEVARRAFEPFFTTKSAGKGTGLGLSMVDEFVRQAGGSATIRTAVGRGTTVSLQLPRSRTAAGSARDLPESGQP